MFKTHHITPTCAYFWYAYCVDYSDPIISKILVDLQQFHPVSVFLYGSRGRGDNKPDSDYEIGVIFDDDKYINRATIHSAITDPQVKAYPFKRGELLNGSLDFLFQKSLYLREIIMGAKTIFGENLIPRIDPLPITNLDLVQDIRFSIARALDALLAFRSGAIQTSMDLLVKSCFYGLRDLEIQQLKIFPLGYNRIYELSHKLAMDADNQAVIEAVHNFRETNIQPPDSIIYDNISLLDSLIEPKLVYALKQHGDSNLL